jgi:hypothetical protein
VVRAALTRARERTDTQSVSRTAPSDHARRKPGWLTLAIVLGAVPFLCALVVHDVIFHFYGNGHFIPVESNGTHVLHFWSEQGGMYLTPVVVAFCVLVVRRASLLAAAAIAALAALSTFLILILAVMWAVLVDGASLG